VETALRSRLEEAPSEERRGLLVQDLYGRLGEGSWPSSDVALDSWPLPRNELASRLGVHPNELVEGATLESLAAFILGEAGLAPQVARQGRWVFGSPLGEPAGPTLERPVVFLLSVPRSGSTLVRVMLAGHSQLFSPPELMLLPFARMQGRREILTRYGYDWARVGIRQALEELGDDRAEARLAEWEERDAPAGEVYGYLQERAAPRILLDKTPSNLASLDFLKQAERLFANPRYLFLVRHPGAVIESFVRMRFQGLLGANFGLWDEDPVRFAAEVWAVWNEHALQFQKLVSPERFKLVRYEDVVRAPRQAMGEVCAFLGLPEEEAMLDPYAAGRVATVDGHGSATLGDWNLGEHHGIDPAEADKWKTSGVPLDLTERAHRIAADLGYE